MAKTAWKWKSKRWWLWVVLFWFVSATGCGIISRTGGDHAAEGIFVLVLLFIFSIFAAITDREWQPGKRILWAIGIPLMFFAVKIPMVIVSVLMTYTKPEMADRANTLSAAIVLFVWAMWRSKYFVEMKDSPKQDISK